MRKAQGGERLPEEPPRGRTRGSAYPTYETRKGGLDSSGTKSIVASLCSAKSPARCQSSLLKPVVSDPTDQLAQSSLAVSLGFTLTAESAAPAHFAPRPSSVKIPPRGVSPTASAYHGSRKVPVHPRSGYALQLGQGRIIALGLGQSENADSKAAFAGGRSDGMSPVYGSQEYVRGPKLCSEPVIWSDPVEIPLVPAEVQQLDANSSGWEGESPSGSLSKPRTVGGFELASSIFREEPSRGNPRSRESLTKRVHKISEDDPRAHPLRQIRGDFSITYQDPRVETRAVYPLGLLSPEDQLVMRSEHAIATAEMNAELERRNRVFSKGVGAMSAPQMSVSELVKSLSMKRQAESGDFGFGDVSPDKRVFTGKSFRSAAASRPACDYSEKDGQDLAFPGGSPLLLPGEIPVGQTDSAELPAGRLPSSIGDNPAHHPYVEVFDQDFRVEDLERSWGDNAVDGASASGGNRGASDGAAGGLLHPGILESSSTRGADVSRGAAPRVSRSRPVSPAFERRMKETETLQRLLGSGGGSSDAAESRYQKIASISAFQRRQRPNTAISNRGYDAFRRHQIASAGRLRSYGDTGKPPPPLRNYTADEVKRRFAAQSAHVAQSALSASSTRPAPKAGGGLRPSAVTSPGRSGRAPPVSAGAHSAASGGKGKVAQKAAGARKNSSTLPASDPAPQLVLHGCAASPQRPRASEPAPSSPRLSPRGRRPLPAHLLTSLPEDSRMYRRLQEQHRSSDSLVLLGEGEGVFGVSSQEKPSVGQSDFENHLLPGLSPLPDPYDRGGEFPGPNARVNFEEARNLPEVALFRYPVKNYVI